MLYILMFRRISGIFSRLLSKSRLLRVANNRATRNVLVNWSWRSVIIPRLATYILVLLPILYSVVAMVSIVLATWYVGGPNAFLSGHFVFDWGVALKATSVLALYIISNMVLHADALTTWIGNSSDIMTISVTLLAFIKVITYDFLKEIIIVGFTNPTGLLDTAFVLNLVVALKTVYGSLMYLFTLANIKALGLTFGSYLYVPIIGLKSFISGVITPTVSSPISQMLLNPIFDTIAGGIVGLIAWKIVRWLILGF